MEIFVYFCVISIIISDFAMVLQGNDSEDDTNHRDDNVFTPTRDWQPLKKDQAIPRGLHVRMNLQTGEREAKLLDPDESEESSSNQMTEIKQKTPEIIPKYQAPNKQVKILREDLQYALHKLEEGFESVAEQEDVERVKKQFRSYSDLKKELGQMKLNVKTDQEVITQLVNEYKDSIERRSGPADRKELEAEESLLNQLEFLIHQIDNAVEFVKLNGVRDVVFPSINSTSWKVRYEATKLLGSAVQNNPKAQIITLEAGAIPVLLRVLALDSNSKVKAGSLYALSCLIRRFPLAQKQFLDRGGLTAIVKQFNSDTSEQLKLQLKAINLVRDLIDEVREADYFVQDSTQDAHELEILSEKHKQLTQLNFWIRLVEEGWCQALSTLLSRHSADAQVIEILSDGMAAIAEECYTAFKDSENTINRLSERYRHLIGNSDYDYQWIHNNLNKLLKVLRERRRDEL